MHYFSKYLLSTIYLFSVKYIKTFYEEMYFGMIYGNSLHSDFQIM